MRVLVCGGRHFDAAEQINQVLTQLHAHQPISLLIHGAAPGADRLASDWAIQQGLEQMVFPADWQRYGRAAGPRRNQQMLLQGKPDLVVAFAGGRGTANMLLQAEQAGVRTWVVPVAAT